MTVEQDPVLRSLFDAAERQLEDAEFTGAVVERMDQRRRRLLAGKIAVLASIVLLEVLLESPLSNSLGQVAKLLGEDLIPISGGWLGFLLSPVNSIAGLVGMTLLALNLLYRKIVY